MQGALVQEGKHNYRKQKVDFPEISKKNKQNKKQFM
jgi:hypothetical protein